MSTHRARRSGAVGRAHRSGVVGRAHSSRVVGGARRHRVGGGARRHRAVRAVTAVVVVLAALGATAAVLASRADVDQVAVLRLTEIERLAPLDTSQLVVTPGLGQDNEWWNSVIAFMPALVHLDNLKPTSDLGITHLGYSFSAADPALGLDQAYARMLYVETDSAEHAKKVEGWLSSSKGAAAGAFSTTISGHTVVLAMADVPLLAELPRNGEGLGSTAAYRQDTAQREPGSLIWEDWGAYVKAAGASGGKPAQYSRFFHGATGFVKGSRWVGYSISPMAGWSGKFQSGGMDSKLVSGTDVAAAIQSYSKVLARNIDGPAVIDGGAGNYLDNSFYVMHPDPLAALAAKGSADPGAKPPEQVTMGSPRLAFKPKSEGDTAFSFDPAAWLAGTSMSATSHPEGLSMFAYSINGDRINLKVTVDRVNMTAVSTPVQTLAPPPAPPGSIPIPAPTGTEGEGGIPRVP
jgi:hypothetical protein